MIFIAAKFRVRPADTDAWSEIVRPFTEATRAEPGCLWFEWSRSLEDPAEYVLVEAFADEDAGAAHVTSAHFRDAQQTLPLTSRVVCDPSGFANNSVCRPC